MFKREFSAHERYAVFTVHGERCYICRTPLDLQSMEVDHVLPESLEGEPKKLTDALAAFSLPPSFNLQSFENWLPACRRCNKQKRAQLFAPTLLVQMHLTEAKTKAARAAELAQKSLTRQSLSRSWNTLLRAVRAGELPEDIRAAIVDVAEELDAAREPSVRGEPLRLSPLLQVLQESGGIRVVRGPYGVGVSPADMSTADRSWRCVCGHSAWNGARCVVCGNIDDD